MRLRSRALLALSSAVALSACAYDDYGYGYGGVAVGYGTGYGGYHDPWYDPYWDHYSSYPYWGWNSGFYYPGSGFFVYDQWRRPHRWNDRQRRFWVDRRSHWDRRGHWNGRREWRDNWDDFRRDRDWNRGGRRDWRRDGRRGDDGRRRWRRGD